MIEPYVTWGFINKQNLKDLVFKRGSYKRETGEVAELDNDLIEAQLGKFNILCLEDIVYELSGKGKHFNEAMEFLGFFLLSPCEDVKEKVNVKFEKGGQQGSRGDKINDLLKKMI